MSQFTSGIKILWFSHSYFGQTEHSFQLQSSVARQQHSLHSLRQSSSPSWSQLLEFGIWTPSLKLFCILPIIFQFLFLVILRSESHNMATSI